MKNFIITAHSANHSLRQAEYFDKKGYLNKLISIYPKFKLKRYGIKRNKIKTLFFVTLIFLLRRILKIKVKNQTFSNFFNYFSIREISKNCNKDTVVIGLSGYCLQIINYAKKKKLITIVDRACPHISIQKKIILNEIDILPITNKKKLKERYFDNQIVEQMLEEYENCDFISVPSKFSFESFKNFNLDKKIIFNALPPEKQFQIIPTNNQINELVIFSLGFNFIRKGFYYLIETIRMLENYNIKLILRTEIPPYLNIKLPKNVQIINNHLNNIELEKIYNSMDILILPSVDEGFGMVALEAMCLKKPIIITKNVGMKDILNNYMVNPEKFIIEPGSIEALKNKILEFYDERNNLKKYGVDFYNAANIYLKNDVYKNYFKIFKNND